MTGPSEPWTIIRLIRWTAEYLAGKGAEQARLDAEVLLADLLGLSRVQLYLNFDRPLEPPELAGFRERVRRRAAREPVAYITGRKEFYSLDLAVDRRVMIPRPETEHLVEEAVRLARSRWPESEELKIVDLGTGCGAVAVALASELGQARLWALDISEPALEVARANIEAHGLADRISLVQGDLLAPLSEQGPFHLIAANLPYVPRPAWAELSVETRDYEPRTALDGGEDGLELIGRAAAQTRGLLGPGGALLLEIWPANAAAVQDLGLGLDYAEVRIVPDLAGWDRVAVLERG